MINECTIKAIQVLIDLFTADEKETLKITSGEQIISLAHQFISRWWTYKVIAENPFVFQAQAAKILDANRSLIDMLKKVKQDSLFDKLLDPENYKDKKVKGTKAKRFNKVENLSDSNNATVNKNITSSLSGEEGLSKTTDYSRAWENEDVLRLNSIQLERNKLGTLEHLSTETGQEDHMLPTDWFEKSESLDQSQIVPKEAKELKRTAINFSTIEGEGPSSQMNLQSAAITKGRNISTAEGESSSLSVTESLMRQNFDTTSDRIILANAIKDIQNLDFVDIREKLYRKFDPLFYEDNKTCP